MSNAPRQQPDKDDPGAREAQGPEGGPNDAHPSGPHRKSVPGFDPAEKPGTGPQSPTKAE